MNAAIEELSRNRCLRLLRLREGDREQVQLVLASSGDVVLDLSDAGCRVEGCAFDVGGRALLYLRLSREDGSLRMYPVTLDLDTGLFYHGDPRHAHAPAGQAADIERMARGEGFPPAFDPARAVRWPVAERLAAEAVPLPEEPKPEPSAAEQPEEQPESEPQQSSDGRWRLEAWTFEDGPDGYQGHARILDTDNQQVVFDLDGSNWYSRGRFNPCAYQLWLELQHADGVQRMNVFIDLDCLLYWEQDDAGKFLSDGRLRAPLAELQQRLLAPSVRGKPRLSVVARATPQRRNVTSPDGRYRVDLFPSGRSELNARGERMPYYHALLTDIETGRIVVDTRVSREEAWLEDAEGMRMNLARPVETDVWVAVDLRRGVCHLENFREPLSENMPLEELALMLSRNR